MDKKNFTSKITFKLFEEYQADLAKIPGFIEELKLILSELKKHSILPTNTQDDITYIEVKDWFFEGGQMWNTFNEDESHEGQLEIHNNPANTDYIITFKWWDQLKRDDSNDVTGPNQEWELDLNVESIYHYENDGENEISIPLTKENEELIKEIIFEVNKNNK